MTIYVYRFKRIYYIDFYNENGKYLKSKNVKSIMEVRKIAQLNEVKEIIYCL